VFAFGFSENRKCAAKAERNSLFGGRGPHISDRLYVYEFLLVLKKIKFSLKIHKCYPSGLPKIASLR
jgi:hypothetical protein